jgi:hypothetical protein
MIVLIVVADDEARLIDFIGKRDSATKGFTRLADERCWYWRFCANTTSLPARIA